MCLISLAAESLQISQKCVQAQVSTKKWNSDIVLRDIRKPVFIQVNTVQTCASKLKKRKFRANN